MSEVAERIEFTPEQIRARSEELATDAFYQWTDEVDEWLVEHAFEHWPDAVAACVRAAVVGVYSFEKACGGLRDAYVSDALQRATYWDRALEQLDDDRGDQ